jgi:multicomponent Na+:H+ antiporter subunit E
MNQVIKFLVIVGSLALTWLGLNGFDMKIDRLFFLISTPLVSYLIASYLKILPKTIKLKINFIFYFLWLAIEILKSAFVVIKIIWSRNININSTFEWIELKNSDQTFTTIYANSITLTPGTVTIDIKDDMLLVHALNSSLINDLKSGEMANKVENILVSKNLST